MKKIYLLILPLLANLSLQSADAGDSKLATEVAGLNIRDAALAAIERLDGVERAHFQALIDRAKWKSIANYLPDDLKAEYAAYAAATKIIHSPRKGTTTTTDSSKK
jgi:hypothetical protein